MNKGTIWKKVQRAVTSGRIVKPDRCERCGKAQTNRYRLTAHHEDYAFPLDVIFLCGRCHLLRHGEINRANVNGA